MNEPDTCPHCGTNYDQRLDLTRRTGLEVAIPQYSRLCTDAEQRQGGPTMKRTRADTEKYQFWGYLNR